MPHGAGAASGGPDPEEGLVTLAHCTPASGPPESLASADAPGLLGGENGQTGHGARAWGLSAPFPSCVEFLATKATLVGSLPEHLLCILLGPLPASGQGDASARQSYHLSKSSPSLDICLTLNTSSVPGTVLSELLALFCLVIV